MIKVMSDKSLKWKVNLNDKKLRKSFCELLLTLITFQSVFAFAMANTSKIVIIGAGVSGISAAVKLIENGFEDVTILEVNDRIGGRVHSVPFGVDGALIDLGAQWVSGENQVYEMMKNNFSFGDTGITEKNQEFLSSDGKVLNQKDCIKLGAVSSEIMERYSEMLISEETYGNFFKTRYFAALEADEFKNIDKELINQMLEQHHRVFNAIYASANWNEVPVKYIPGNEYCEGSQSMTWRKSGYKTFLLHLMVTETNNIQLNCRMIAKLSICSKNSNAKNSSILMTKFCSTRKL